MNTKKRLLLIFLILFSLLNYLTGTKSVMAEENKPCEKNYTKQGSSFLNMKGMEEKTWIKFNNVPLQNTLKAAIASAPHVDWSVISVDKNKGVIEARGYYGSMIIGSSAEALVSIDVKSNGNGSIINLKTMVFQTGYSADSAMCKYLEIVERILKSY